MTRHEEMRIACQAFHVKHPEVWEMFVKFALEKADLGYDHYGVSGVFERVRWETSVGDGEPELKINNNFKPFYARRFNAMNPHLGGGEFFRLREQITLHRPATGRPEFVTAR